MLINKDTVQIMINVNIEYINETGEEPEITPDMEENSKLVITNALLSEGFDRDCKVSLTLTDEDTIKNLNNETRGIDKVTDVLSFPNIDFETPADYSVLDDEDSYFDIFDPDTDEVILGDIVICLKRAKEQASEYGHSLKRELSFLTAHSILHLLGYDHMEDEERLVMEDKQNKILNNLNITR